MNITVCERGCGRTSLDPEAHIETIQVSARSNGDEAYKASTEACQHCRKNIMNTLTSLFTPIECVIDVRARQVPKKEGE